MKIKSIFNKKNLDSCLKSLDKGLKSFNKSVSDFGDSMQKMDQDLKDDISKSNSNAVKREKINKENLDRIWGKKE